MRSGFKTLLAAAFASILCLLISVDGSGFTAGGKRMAYSSSVPTTPSMQGTGIEKTLRSLGYRITWKISAAGADWELRDFNMRSKQVFAIKSKTKVPGEKNMYYRYSVQIEEYTSEADAQKRIDHISATPPGPNSKMVGPEHDLRVGFRRGTLVYVVSTDVYKFVVDGSLNKFRLQLEEKIPAK